MSRVTKYFSLFTFLVSIFLPNLAHATSYDVSASVPYPIPTIPATIDTNLVNQTVENQVFRVTGSCEFVSPATIISIYRSGASIGSTSCSAGGRYQLDVSLVIGANELIIRSSNISNEYGPDSTVGTVTLSLLTLTPQQIAEEQKARSDLSIVSENPFVAVTEKEKTATVSIVVSGGGSPYVIDLNWGDGTIESRKVDVAGTYIFTHEYAKPGTYRAVAVVTDVLGVQREHYFAVVNAGPLSEEKKSDAESLTEVCAADSSSPLELECTAKKSWLDYVKIPAGIVAIFLSGTAFGVFRSRRKPALIPRVKKNDKKK